MIDLDTPLIYLTQQDAWTVRDSFEGVQVFGGTGSGKSSGSGKAFARALLENQYGGLVTTVKSNDSEDMCRWAEECGRRSDVILMKPSEPRYLDFLYEQSKLEDGNDTESLTSLLMVLVEIANGGATESKEAYWTLALRQLIRNSIDVLKCADQPVTIAHMYRVIVSAPTSLMRLASEEFQRSSFCYACLDKGAENVDQILDTQIPEIHHRDFDVAFLYWTSEFPNLSEKTRSIIVSMFTTTADAFMRGSLRTMFSDVNGGLPCPPDLARQGKIIILDLPIKKWEQVGKIGQSVYKLMFQKSMERTPFSESGAPVFIYSDENQFFINSFDLVFQQTARSSGVATIYLSQNIANYHTYLGDNGETKANSLLGNLSTKIFHANADPKTNEWAAKLIGEDWNMQSSSSINTSHDDDASLSASVREEKRFLVDSIRFSELMRGGEQNDFIVEALIHQVGREWSTGEKFIRCYFSQK